MKFPPEGLEKSSFLDYRHRGEDCSFLTDKVKSRNYGLIGSRGVVVTSDFDPRGSSIQRDFERAQGGSHKNRISSLNQFGFLGLAKHSFPDSNRPSKKSILG
jgi:hypothetical protein